MNDGQISMVSAALLGKVHARCQLIMENYHEDFGGLNVILCGDFHQVRAPRLAGYAYHF